MVKVQRSIYLEKKIDQWLVKEAKEQNRDVSNLIEVILDKAYRGEI